ncbi:serine hydroxymethyltransferase [Candidatus Micrarchaeota archaeon]|nr:MAG: serine hydroxymethyltransferase [Candidatus Micrarchaeota archaeon]
MEFLRKADPEMADIMQKELERQRNTLELIGSENFTYEAVLEAAGSVMTNKYSEGYPFKRYYGGNQFIDLSEQLAIDRAKKLFNAEHANVQPHSGSQANMAAYFALLEPGDTFIGMSLAHGGHLSHGHPVNFSGKIYKAVQYGVRKEDQLIDFEQIRKLMKEHKAKLMVMGATAYPREYDFKQAREICDEFGCLLMADIAHIAGLIVGGVHQHPFPHADVVTSTTQKTLRGPRGGLILCKEEYAKAIDRAVFPMMQGGPLDHIIAAKAVCFHLAMQPEFKDYARQIVKNAKAMAEELISQGLDLVTGGTDTHLILADVTPKGLTGKEAETVLDEVGITVNKNMIPFDSRKPFDPSGIRIGTPALTSRGMKESEMRQIADMIVKVLEHPNDESIKKKVREEVKELCEDFPLYPEIEYI